METIQRQSLKRYVTHRGIRYQRLGAWHAKYDDVRRDYPDISIIVSVERKGFKTMHALFRRV